MTATLVQSHTCPDCQHAARIDAITAALDPDRLADRARGELRNWTSDEADVLWYGPGHMLLVDPTTGETWEGEFTRTAEQQLRFALVHMAAALAAGARI
ncbi:hypothetical protein [Mycobacteroides abscessus]|uniref:hypothetical protein n=1 Tax=Mycobacteroides abscessus TaxID=36809 RepID=UPI0005DD0FF2|nr:hypothetical protein [Mycobacteroides abscessus]CPR69601.1 Uncharacterised protein [Mycobacteroides abscessus]CPU70592.1 Uncharacterised protein [Mycobacteroides abscessus]